MQLSTWLVLVGLHVAYGVEDRTLRLRSQSILYGIASDAVTSQDDGTPCRSNLTAFRSAVDSGRPWALKMLDASGSAGGSFLWGNNYWLGSYSQCRAIPLRMPYKTAATLARNLSAIEDAWPPFPIQFFVATFRHNASLQEHVSVPNEDLITLGLCLPDTCSPGEVSELLAALFSSRPLDVQRLYNADFQLEEVRSMRPDNSWLTQPRFIVVGSVLCLVLLLLVLGTVYDTVIWQRRPIPARELDCITEKGETAENNNMQGFSTKCIRQSFEAPPGTKLQDVRQQGALARFLHCFSIYSNTILLLDTGLGPDSVPAIHGLRFISMAWIVMVHTIFYLSDYVDNKPQAYLLSEGFMVQIISNSTLSVDTFFFLSGFLVAYLYYKSHTGNKSIGRLKEFLVMVLRRFLRLTPAYMMVLGIVVVNSSWYNSTSLFHSTERADLVCPQYWWRNLLYINNVFSREQMCMSWSWYLSNDMQFFIIGTMILILSSTYWLLSICIMAALLVGSSLLTGFISYSYGYVPTLDQQLSMLDVLYDPPWTRIGPYIVGMVTAQLVVKLDGTLSLSKSMLTLCWIIGPLFNLAALFGLYQREICPLAAAVYVALSRTAWGAGLAWLIVACCTGNAGFINRILSFPAWVPLSRLTYCAYLLNPMIINSVYLYDERAVHVEFLSLTIYFLGLLFSSYICAYLASLAFETPTVVLMRKFTARR